MRQYNCTFLSYHWLVKESAFIMQSKSTFLEFFDVYSSLQIWTPRKILQGRNLFRVNDLISIEHMLCSQESSFTFCLASWCASFRGTERNIFTKCNIQPITMISKRFQGLFSIFFLLLGKKYLFHTPGRVVRKVPLPSYVGREIPSQRS